MGELFADLEFILELLDEALILLRFDRDVLQRVPLARLRIGHGKDRAPSPFAELVIDLIPEQGCRTPGGGRGRRRMRRQSQAPPM